MQKLLVLALLAGVLFEGYQYLDSNMYRYVLFTIIFELKCITSKPNKVKY